MILIYLQDKMRNIARHKSVTDPMEFKQFDYLYCDSSSEDSSDEFDQPIPHPATSKYGICKGILWLCIRLFVCLFVCLFVYLLLSRKDRLSHVV